MEPTEQQRVVRALGSANHARLIIKTDRAMYGRRFQSTPTTERPGSAHTLPCTAGGARVFGALAVSCGDYCRPKPLHLQMHVWAPNTSMKYFAPRLQRHAAGGRYTIVHLTITRLSLDHEKLGYFTTFALHFCASFPLLDTHGFDVVGVPMTAGGGGRG